MFPILAAAAVGKGILGLIQNSKANQIHPQWQQYQANPLAAQQLATAQNAYNGRMGGALAQEQGIYNAQANTQASVERNATDAGTALAMAAAGQGSTNDALNKLGVQEAQNKYNLLGNLNQAYGTNIAEGDKVYNSMMQKYQMDTQAQKELRSAAFNNIFGGINDLATGQILGANAGGAANGGMIASKVASSIGGAIPNAASAIVQTGQQLPGANIPSQLSLNHFMPSMVLPNTAIPMQGAAQAAFNPQTFNWLGR